MWAEVEIAKSEQRHELVLQGKELTEKLERNEGRADENIFSLGQWSGKPGKSSLSSQTRFSSKKYFTIIEHLQ